MKGTKLLPICLVGLILLLSLASFGSSTGNEKPVAVFLYRQAETDDQTGSNVKPKTESGFDDAEAGSDPDMPPGLDGTIDKESYLRMREEYIALRRGIE